MARGITVAVVVVLVGLVAYFSLSKLLSSKVETRQEEALKPPLILGDNAPPALPEGNKTEGGEVTANPAAETPKEGSADAMTKEAAAARLDQAQRLIQQDKLYEAREVLSKLIFAADEGRDRDKIRSMLENINARLFFSPEPSPDSLIYTVGKGEVLWTIQRKVHSSVELIKLVNRKTNDVLREGEVLKIPQGTFSALVDRAHFRLMVFLNGHYIKEYPVGIGKQDLTPTGTFDVEKMDVNPSWTDPQGKFHPFGSPENILGSRWIGFKAVGTRSGLGIHGTTDDASIGTKCSNGCIRMHNKDVEEIFGMLRKGDKVTVK